MVDTNRQADGTLPFDPPIVLATDRSGVDSAGGFEPFLSTGPEDPPVPGSDAPIHGVAMSTFHPETGRPHLVYVSENLAHLLGRSPFELLGRSPELLFDPATPDRQLAAVADVVESGNQAIVSLSLRHRDGDVVPVRASFLAVPSAGASPCYLSLFRSADPRQDPRAIDVPPRTDHDELLDALAAGADLGEVLRIAADEIEVSIADADCLIALTDHAGALEPAIGSRFRVETIADLAEVMAARIDEAAGRDLTESGGTSTPCCVRVDDLPLELGIDLRERDIHAVWAWPIEGVDHRMRGVVLVAHDDRPRPDPAEVVLVHQVARLLAVAVERTTAEADLAFRALHDPLTHLPNRALIVDRLEQAVARLGRDDNRLAVLLVDLDRFKALNATRGPEVGDQVLVEVARRLRRSVRLGDTVGRIGGDQFLVLCVAMNGEADASAMAERITAGLEAEIEIDDDDEVVISSSVGVVLVDRPGSSPAAIIASAESALAKAVEERRGGFAMFEASWQPSEVRRHELERELADALDAGQFEVHYQPIVETKTSEMVGAEALLRWNRPGEGLVGPDRFMEIAEASGMIIPIGAWVIDEVCRSVAAWPRHDERRGPVISINLSAGQLSEPSLVSEVLDAIERHGTDPRLLGFEVTESMRVEQVEVAAVTLRELAALGCKVSIDDFGIGHATLDYLRRFSMAHSIKIDRSFVDGLGESREDTAIVNASLALAASLGLRVVAEGVETGAQLAALAALGCDYVQGYGLGRPVPLADAEAAWQRRWLGID